MPSVKVLPKEIYDLLHKCSCGEGIHTLEEDMGSFRIFCVRCKTKGPKAESIKVAMKLWNAQQLIS